jgi:hypothetical protein
MNFINKDSKSIETADRKALDLSMIDSRMIHNPNFRGPVKVTKPVA